MVTDTDDPTWYKDAVIYQLHVKAFFDGNDDGIGDFKGLLERLDYIQNLGVTAVWLLPFYPSPLRDDGYDISDYRAVHPSYGTMSDVRKFIREVHHRGMKVITELVVNHTSDQHPWFQRARRAPAGSSHRNYYVWSDTDQRYAGTRIIFSDTEKSNWTWDPVAGAYFWHRFYSHQPDLNFENPAVARAILNVMRFWLDAGIDGLRLDAVPYLCEREGTNNENLAETHSVLRQLRANVDASYRGRMLLAEANQWPEDVRPYFGDGDECHMAFHFPLMPRIYMAVAQEDRHPITDILRQTPDIPENCQWAIFLRNHDELTLEMVTDRERDYLWTYYASDARTRINLGIRRRLAPLMENNRAKIDLLNGLLMTMPGTPILYYGDEIGMGDNVYLGDRDGVRTPMQWSVDRNGGFSRADPARLYLPVIQDPVYGYQSVNVEAQSRTISSLLSNTRRLIAARQTVQAFGRGALIFLYPRNRKILAYLRQYKDETILCVFNLSRSAQPLELDLEAYKGRIPVELLSRSVFPAIADRLYGLTLQGYGFLWFSLIDPTQATSALIPQEPEPMPEFVTLVSPRGWKDLFAGRDLVELAGNVLPLFLPKQRWFGAKDRSIREVGLIRLVELPSSEPGSLDQDGWVLLVGEARFEAGAAEHYLLPLGMMWGTAGAGALAPLLPQTLAQLRRARTTGILYDAAGQSGLILELLRGIEENARVACLPAGELRFQRTKAFGERELPANRQISRIGAEQSNSSILIEGLGVLKIYRRLWTGIHPEIEMGRYLVEVAKFKGTPPLLGTIEMIDEAGNPMALGVLSSFIENQGDGWKLTLAYLRRSFEDWHRHELVDGTELDPHSYFMTLATNLGQKTAEMHLALCPDDETDPAFIPEPVTAADLNSWCAGVRQDAARIWSGLEIWLRQGGSTDAALIDRVTELLTLRAALLDRVAVAAAIEPALVKTRYHGDFHLGQVLVVENDFRIIDFEGEPRRPLDERRQKHTPLKDVAGMLRSVDYAAAVAIRNAVDLPATDRVDLEGFCVAWRDRTFQTYFEAYRAKVAGAPIWPSDETHAVALLNLLIIEKALYEIGYELANRPAWLIIPVEGLIRVLTRERGAFGDA